MIENPPPDKFSDHIFIPVKLRGVPVPAAPAISVRLTKTLSYRGVKVFGDLHGLRLSEFGTFRNCGKITVSELGRLIQRIRGGLTTAGHLADQHLSHRSRLFKVH